MIRSRKLNISLVFITQFYFTVLKNIRPNSRHYFIMKIPNKKDLQQTGFDHWSDIDLKKFVSFYKKCTAKPYYFLVIDATLASDNLLERMQRLIMTINEKIRNEKGQYDINREAAKISALSSRKTDKYEYITREENYHLIIEKW